jgi:hypothetical protein
VDSVIQVAIQLAVWAAALTLMQLTWRGHSWAAWLMVTMHIAGCLVLLAGTLGAFLAEEYLFAWSFLGVAALWGLLISKIVHNIMHSQGHSNEPRAPE